MSLLAGFAVTPRQFKTNPGLLNVYGARVGRQSRIISRFSAAS